MGEITNQFVGKGKRSRRYWTKSVEITSQLRLSDRRALRGLFITARRENGERQEVRLTTSEARELLREAMSSLDADELLAMIARELGERYLPQHSSDISF